MRTDVGRGRQPVCRETLRARTSPQRAPAGAPAAPAILVGGGGERKTLRLVARYADACGFIERGLGPEGLRRKCAVLREHCERVGRDYAEIDKTVLSRVSRSRDGTGNAPSGGARSSRSGPPSG